MQMSVKQPIFALAEAMQMTDRLLWSVSACVCPVQYTLDCTQQTLHLITTK